MVFALDSRRHGSSDCRAFRCTPSRRNPPGDRAPIRKAMHELRSAAPPNLPGARRADPAGPSPWWRMWLAGRLGSAALLRPWTLLAAVAASLLPWVVYLTVSLPMHHVAVHWRLAWVGFDVTLAAIFAFAAFAARRDSALLPDLLTAGAVLLLCDAWFDIATAASARELAGAVAEAAAAEVPLALFCLGLAHRVRPAAPRPEPSTAATDQSFGSIDTHPY
jgi:hypothetical protein